MYRLLKNIYHKAQQYTIKGLLLLKHQQLCISNLDSVVVISPHPDDEIFGCGGLMMQLNKLGKDVKVIFLSRGEAIARSEQEMSIIVDKRHEIALKALSVIGVSENNIIWLNFPDGNFGNVSDKEVSSLKHTIELLNPDAVFYPHHLENSPDHYAASMIVRNIIKEHNYTGYEYCVWLWYHMPLINAFKLNYNSAFLLPVTDLTLKRTVVKMYADSNDGKGFYFSGKLPELFLDAVSWSKELFFKI